MLIASKDHLVNTQDMDLEVGQLAKVKQKDIDWTRKERKTRKEGKSLHFEGNMMVHYSKNKKDGGTNVCTFFFSCLVGVK
jgi:hypothetical protein